MILIVSVICTRKEVLIRPGFCISVDFWRFLGVACCFWVSLSCSILRAEISHVLIASQFLLTLALAPVKVVVLHARSVNTQGSWVVKDIFVYTSRIEARLCDVMKDLQEIGWRKCTKLGENLQVRCAPCRWALYTLNQQIFDVHLILLFSPVSAS